MFNNIKKIELNKVNNKFYMIALPMESCTFFSES